MHKAYPIPCVCFLCLHCCCYLEVYVAADRLSLLLSIHPRLVFFLCLLSLLGWTAPVFLFSSRCSPLEWDGIGRRVNENFQVLLDILGSSTPCCALDRGAGRTSPAFVCHFINHTVYFYILIVYLAQRGHGCVFCILWLCWMQSSLHCWMTEGQLISKRIKSNVTLWSDLFPLLNTRK